MVAVRDKYELEKLRMSSIEMRDLDVEQMSVDARRLWSKREVVIKEIDDKQMSMGARRRWSKREVVIKVIYDERKM